jgi:predicted DNA binding CopG/RHH family protein
MGQEFNKVPTFQDEDEERTFWATHDSADYLNWDVAEEIVLPKLKPTTQTISLRLSRMMLDELRAMANKRDISYQALIKVFLKERIDQELQQNVRR